MAGLRGPDSSEDERHLGGNAVFPETVDVNIRQLDPIPATILGLIESLISGRDRSFQVSFILCYSETRRNPDFLAREIV